jgi:hypothetical protein
MAFLPTFLVKMLASRGVYTPKLTAKETDISLLGRFDVDQEEAPVYFWRDQRGQEVEMVVSAFMVGPKHCVWASPWFCPGTVSCQSMIQNDEAGTMQG